MNVALDVHAYASPSRLRLTLCWISSTILGSFFLVILVVCASFNFVVHHRPQAKKSLEKPTKDEKKLTTNVDYYVRLSGLKTKRHTVVTSDGFELILDRIVGPHEENGTQGEKPGYPVLMIHGLLQSSAAYCTSGDSSLAIRLAKAGYDVWLGNNRCGFAPRNINCNKYSPEMWHWDMTRLGSIDVPTLVDYVREQTGSDKIALVGHSQGTTQTFVGLAKDQAPETGRKISSFSALAPAIYAGPQLDKWYFRFVRQMGLGWYRVCFGYHSFVGPMYSWHRMLPERVFTFFGYAMFNFLFGWDDRLWSAFYRNRQFIFCPTYVSAQLMYWWIGKPGFANTQCALNQESPEWFDPELLPPLQIVVPGRDDLVDPHRLVNRIKTYEKPPALDIVTVDPYSHMDVLWAADAHIVVGKPLSKFIYEHIPDKSRWRPINYTLGGVHESQERSSQTSPTIPDSSEEVHASPTEPINQLDNNGPATNDLEMDPDQEKMHYNAVDNPDQLNDSSTTQPANVI